MKRNVLLSLIFGFILGILVIIIPEYSILIMLGIVYIFFMIFNPIIGISGYILCFILPQGTYIGQVIFLLASIFWVIKIFSNPNSQKTLVKSPLNWLILGIFFFALLPILFREEVFEVYLENPKEFFLFIAYSFSTIFIMNIIDSRKKINFISWSLVLFGFLQGIISVIEIYLPNLPFAPLNIAPDLKEAVERQDIGIMTDPVFGSGKTRSVGYIGDGPTVGFHMLSAFFLCIAMSSYEKSKAKKLFLLITGLLISFGILATLSRIVIGAFILACGYFCCKKKISLSKLGIVGLIILVLVLINIENIKFRILQTIEQDSSGFIESIGIKQEIAEIKRFIAHPLVGTGLGRVNEFEGISPYLEEHEFFLSPTDELITERTAFFIRSFFPSISAQLGIGGLLCILLILYYTWKGLNQAELYSKDKGNPEFLNLSIAIKAILVGELICFIITGNPTNKMFWFIVGLAGAINVIAKKNQLELSK